MHPDEVLGPRAGDFFYEKRLPQKLGTAFDTPHQREQDETDPYLFGSVQ